MSREFNHYKWNQFEVKNRADVPNCLHFTALVFGFRTECSPGYDANEAASYYKVPDVRHYVFMKRDDLDRFVLEISQTDTEFVFYSVSKLGKSAIRVDVDVSIDE